MFDTDEEISDLSMTSSVYDTAVTYENDVENASLSRLEGEESVFKFSWGPVKSLNYNLPLLILVAIVLFVVIVATAFGNFLVGLALFRYRYLRTISNYLIGNLALSDFLLATTILPLSIFDECLGHWIFGEFVCNAWLMMDVLYCTASLWNICIIGFDRFTATLYPMWYREKKSAKQAGIYVALVWVIAAAICVPPMLGWNSQESNYQLDSNVTNVYFCKPFTGPGYVLYSACGSFYIPFAITSYFYIRIFIALRQRMRKNQKKAAAAASAAGARLLPPTTTTNANTQPKTQPPQATPALPTNSAAAAITVHGGDPNARQNMELIKVTGRHGDAASGKHLFSSDSDQDEEGSDERSDDVASSVVTAMTSFTTASNVGSGKRSSSSATGSSQRGQIKSDGGRRDNGKDSENGVNASVDVNNAFDNVNRLSAQATNDKNSLQLNKRNPAVFVTDITPVQDTHSTSSSLQVNDVSSKQSRVNNNSETLKLSSSVSFGHNSSKLNGGSFIDHKLASVTNAAKALNPFNAAKGGGGEAVGLKKKTSTAIAAQQRRHEQRELRATMRMGIIIAFFCCMWVGFFTVYVLRSWCGTCYLPRTLDAFFFWLGYSNSSINPILYTIFNEEFRRAFQKILGCYRQPTSLAARRR